MTLTVPAGRKWRSSGRPFPPSDDQDLWFGTAGDDVLFGPQHRRQWFAVNRDDLAGAVAGLAAAVAEPRNTRRPWIFSLPASRRWRHAQHPFLRTRNEDLLLTATPEGTVLFGARRCHRWFTAHIDDLEGVLTKLKEADE